MDIPVNTLAELEPVRGADPAITAQLALVIACVVAGRGGRAGEVLEVADALGVPRESFRHARDLLRGEPIAR